MNRNAKKIKDYIFYSWLIAGGIAFTASSVLFFGLGFFDYSRSIEMAKADLTQKAHKAARRISGELLIAPRGAPEAVRLQMQKELGLQEIAIIPVGEKAKTGEEQLTVEMPVPHLERQYRIAASIPAIRVLDHFNFVLLISSFALIGIIVGAGSWLQTRFLYRNLISPIESLVATSTGEKSVSQEWPLELQEISEKLNSSFQAREQAVYSQIAHGVIHDLRTLLHSFQVATDLVSEKQSEARFLNLFSVCKTKLPNLLSIINTALDGSREITINAKRADLMQTLQSSVETAQAIAHLKGVQIELQKNPKPFLVAHDPVQLDRAFTNIIKNAVEAVDCDSVLNKRIKISCEQVTAGQIQIAIDDSGPGLQNNAENVFRMTKSTKPHGSGLGLTISKKIVEAHEGQIRATYSEELHGARFEILLPAEVQV